MTRFTSELPVSDVTRGVSLPAWTSHKLKSKDTTRTRPDSDILTERARRRRTSLHRLSMRKRDMAGGNRLPIQRKRDVVGG